MDRTALAVSLPGSFARQLTAGPPIPTGVVTTADPHEAITPVPFGTTMLVSRYGFQAGRTARIELAGSAPATGRIDMTMLDGWEDVLLFAPPDGPSISLEPHTCAPGASSLPEHSRDGLRGLAPGARLRVRASILPTPAGR